MTTIEPTLRRRETFAKQVAVARKCALGGYLAPVDILGLTKRGLGYGLDQFVIDEIIALSAETWRNASSASRLDAIVKR